MERRAEQAYGGRRHEPTPQGEKDDIATWPYRELVGALAWLALGTRPDIAFATSSLLDSVITWAAFTGTLRSAYYVTSREPGGWRLRLSGELLQAMAYTHADWGSDRDDRRSIGAYVVKVGCGAVSWETKKQTCVALSSTEAEYVALCQAAQESVWMMEFLGGLGLPYRTLWS